MKILLTTPSVNSVNGGIYVIIQWCNHLKSIYGHEVTLFSENRLDRSCNWRKLNVPVVTEFKTGYYDAVIICSPHSIWIEDVLTTERGFLFCQMHEALKEYKPLRKKYLAEHSECEMRLPGCDKIATDIHHCAGRGINLNNVSTWKSACRECHMKLHNELSAEEARELGLKTSAINQERKPII